MSCDNVMIGGELYVPACSVSPVTDDDDRRYVIVRAKDAGVHAGYLDKVDYEHKVAFLVNSRRLWRWYAGSLSGLATDGLTPGSNSKLGNPVNNEIAGWCEIIDCTEQARSSIQEWEKWKND
jgi:hypothetical protein